VTDPSIHAAEQGAATPPADKWRWLSLLQTYPLPPTVLALILVSVGLAQLGESRAARATAGLAIVVGGWPLFRGFIEDLRRGKYALDYIAVLAIATSVATAHELVGAVIALMYLGGRTLEEYGVRRARRSLSLLADRIPNQALVQAPDGVTLSVSIYKVSIGQIVLVRHGEVVPLDRELIDPQATLDESSLTGEPFLLDKVQGDEIRSGTVNVGRPIALRVLRTANDSTYHRILTMVAEAQASSAPLVRLAERYSVGFTVVTLALAAAGWYLSGDPVRALAVLVVATPCPLILATPIALMGGVNRAARERIIVKQLAALEVLTRVRCLIFDKTGTITVGRPTLVEVRITPGVALGADEALGIAAAVERQSLHPVAKALVDAARDRLLPGLPVEEVRETVGVGIEARVSGRAVRVRKSVSERQEMRVELELDGVLAATFVLEDHVKPRSRQVLEALLGMGIEVAIATGDRRAAAERAMERLGLPLTVEAECTPAAKRAAIGARQRAGLVVGMVGDGINDAPALAQADVGLVFAHEEQTAASEAGDVILLGGDVESVWRTVVIARDTVRVATQCILLGIGLSVVAMLFAAAGYIPPIVGALLQEGIDVAVIVNALRATQSHLPPLATPADPAAEPVVTPSPRPSPTGSGSR
jgi:heavy metal translocating P-type ATPase